MSDTSQDSRSSYEGNDSQESLNLKSLSSSAPGQPIGSQQNTISFTSTSSADADPIAVFGTVITREFQPLLNQPPNILSGQAYRNLSRLRSHFAPSADNTQDMDSAETMGLAAIESTTDNNATPQAKKKVPSLKGRGKLPSRHTPKRHAKTTLKPSLSKVSPSTPVKRSSPQTRGKNPAKALQSNEANGSPSNARLVKIMGKNIRNGSSADSNANGNTTANAPAKFSTSDSWYIIRNLEKLETNPNITKHLAENANKDALTFLKGGDHDSTLQDDIETSNSWTNLLATCFLKLRQRSAQKDLSTAIGLFYMNAYHQLFVKLFGPNARIGKKRRRELGIVIKELVTKMPASTGAGHGSVGKEEIMDDFDSWSFRFLRAGSSLSHIAASFGAGAFLVLSDYLTEHILVDRITLSGPKRDAAIAHLNQLHLPEVMKQDGADQLGVNVAAHLTSLFAIDTVDTLPIDEAGDDGENDGEDGGKEGHGASEDLDMDHEVDDDTSAA